MTEERRIENFEEFWPFYVREHAKRDTRRLHFVGTTVAMGCLAAGLLAKKPGLLALVPLVGYGPAWIAHFFVENNRPASFKYPGWSFKADLVMWSKMVRGRMDEEVSRVVGTSDPQPSNSISG
ncbi:DUF962 domain-containing protein [Chondromyces crocatus]|uniref:Membrane protein n=1 Tax=Chondromyces crocatus TaxID=52 RepID=A0A0K1EQT4_CHOCO|nr:DUF962 domain-containing protein [Chondromyces crocatus]AKT43196.1 membrane protein [Chondromyces crocatus]